MIRIKIEGKNIADIWKLACVVAITKIEDNISIKVRYKKSKKGGYYYLYANIGDYIVVRSEKSKFGDVDLEESDL